MHQEHQGLSHQNTLIEENPSELKSECVIVFQKKEQKCLQTA